MPLSMSQVALPVFNQSLEALAHMLQKAERHAADRKIDESAFLQARLFPDMFPMIVQVQIACDFAKGAVARLSGIEVPRWHDHEASLSALRARIARTLDFVRSVPASAIDGSEDRAVSIKTGSSSLDFTGQDYLVTFVLPNFYFHMAMVYALLRHNGVDVGKGDFVGRGDALGRSELLGRMREP